MEDELTRWRVALGYDCVEETAENRTLQYDVKSTRILVEIVTLNDLWSKNLNQQLQNTGTGMRRKAYPSLVYSHVPVAQPNPEEREAKGNQAVMDSSRHESSLECGAV